MPAPTFTSGASLGGDVVVTVNCQFRPITPLVTAIVGSTVQISSRAVFPIRTGGIGRLPTSGGGGGGNPIPVANFSGDQLTGVAPLTVNFTDLSSNAPDGWAWSFGLGEGISASQNPTHTYLTSGSYTVSLTASNGNGYDSEVKFAYITVTAPPPGPTANFTFSPPGGQAPLAVSFTDTSTDNPTAWSWDFDFNGTVNVDSTAQNPSHSYSTEGTYTIRLAVTNNSGSSFVEKTITVDRKICTVPNFAGVLKSNATALWTGRGFLAANISFDPPKKNGPVDYEIKYQSHPGWRRRSAAGRLRLDASRSGHERAARPQAGAVPRRIRPRPSDLPRRRHRRLRSRSGRVRLQHAHERGPGRGATRRREPGRGNRQGQDL